jgi:signal transduction histidine kinase
LGILEDQLDYIFESFTKLKPSNRDANKFKAFGMRLSQVKKYASLLGGMITVTSVVGQGSVFTFALPNFYSELDRDRSILDSYLQ